jgi:hypothetical protein
MQKTRQWKNDSEISFKIDMAFFSVPFSITVDANLQSLQVKLLHRMLPYSKRQSKNK